MSKWNEDASAKSQDKLLEAGSEEHNVDLQKVNEQLKEERESLRLERARLDALLRLSQMSEATLKEVTNFTLEQAIALTNSKIGFVGFLNEDETVYTLHAVSKEVVKECRVIDEPMKWHVVNAGIWADAIRERRTLFVNDYSKPHPRKKGFPSGHPYVKKFIIVPILEGKRIVAIAGVGNKTADYDRSDERQVVLLLRGMWNYVQKAEAELRSKEAERMVTIGQTAGMVGHDIRNPLQAIMGDLYLIKREVEDIPDGKSKLSVLESLDAINESIEYINKIVKDLQDYARKTEPNIEEVNLGTIIQTSLSMIRIPENIQLIYSVEPHVELKTDKEYIERVLTNLITNATQAMPKGGKLTLTAFRQKNTVQIIVEDTGEGVPENIKDKLFTPLFTTKSKGQGFGLAVVKKFVDKLGGNVTLDSQVGKGTKFIVNLPLV